MEENKQKLEENRGKIKKKKKINKIRKYEKERKWDI